MNTSVDVSQGEGSWVPVESCTLPTTTQPLRVAEFDDLFAEALTDVERPRGDHVRLVMSGPTGLRDRLQDLARRETECCSFFTFAVTTPAGDPATVLVDIAVPPNRADVLTALVDRAEGHLRLEERR
jgi:hypothetical protein